MNGQHLLGSKPILLAALWAQPSVGPWQDNKNCAMISQNSPERVSDTGGEILIQGYFPDQNKLSCEITKIDGLPQAAPQVLDNPLVVTLKRASTIEVKIRVLVFCILFITKNHIF